MKKRSNAALATKVIVFAAVFAAIGAVLGHLLVIRPAPSVKYTLDKFVIFLSGMFFGPVVGGMVGFVADFAGGTVFGSGFTPWLCLHPILYGVAGGLFRRFLSKKFSLPRLMLAYFFPITIASIVVQSIMLALTYGPFKEQLYLNLVSRSVQFAIMYVVEVAIIFVLVKSGLFKRVGLWPPTLKPVKEKK